MSLPDEPFPVPGSESWLLSPAYKAILPKEKYLTDLRDGDVGLIESWFNYPEVLFMNRLIAHAATTIMKLTKAKKVRAYDPKGNMLEEVGIARGK